MYQRKWIKYNMLILCISISQLWSQTPVWQHLPYLPGSDGRHMAFSQSNSDIVYFVADGLYKSEDAGLSWSTVFSWEKAKEEAGSGLYEVCVSSTNPNNVVVSANKGVFISNDGGSTWEKTSSDIWWIYDMTMSFSNPNIIYANGFNLYKSTNGGLTFTEVGVSGNDVAVDPINSNNVYVAKNNELLISEDGGQTWDSLTDVYSGNCQQITIAPSNPQIIYAGTDEGVFKSINAGQTWNKRSPPINYFNIRDIRVDPNDPDIVYEIGAGGIYKSIDGGVTWELLDNGISTNSSYSLGIKPDDTDILLAAHSHGYLDRSTDGGASWIQSMMGLTHNRILSLTTNPRDPDSLYVGAGSSLYLSTNGGSDWPLNSNRYWMDNQVMTIDLPQNPPGVIYVGELGSIKKTYNTGQDWYDLTGTLDSPLSDFEIAGSDSSILYVSTLNDILKSEDEGLTWNKKSTGIEQRLIWCIAVHPENANIVYAGTFGENGIYKTIDGGETWIQKNSGLEHLIIWDILISPLHPDTLYVGTDGGGVYKSTDAGETWQQTNTGLTHFVIGSIAISHKNDQILFVGSMDGGGIFMSGNGGETWEELNEGLEFKYISRLHYSPKNSGIIYAGTFGDGIYKQALINKTPESPELTSPSSNTVIAKTDPIFRWLCPSDYDGDSLHFQIELDQDSDFQSGIQYRFDSNTNLSGFSSTLPSKQYGTEISFTPSFNLMDGMWFWRVRSWDGQAYSEYSSTDSLYIDTSPPYLSNLEPDSNAVNVLRETDIIVHVVDPGFGVNESTITMSVNGNVVNPETSGDPNDYRLQYDPPESFDYLQEVTVSISAEDNAGFVATDLNYSFTIVTEVNIAPESPTPVSPIDTLLTSNQPVFTFNVPADANNDSLHFKIELSQDSTFQEEVLLYESRTDTSGFTPHPPVPQDEGIQTFQPSVSLAEGFWYWHPVAWDGTEYGSSSETQTFMIDTKSPAVSEFYPVNRATQVLLDDSIYFHLKDMSSGVDSSTLKITVNDIVVIPDMFGDSADYFMIYKPATPFKYLQTVTVTIDVSDFAGNQMETDQYSFTIQNEGDFESPVLVHTPVQSTESGESVDINVTASDNTLIDQVTLYYRQGGDQSYTSIEMEKYATESYKAAIPQNVVTERGIEYYILASDTAGNIKILPSVQAETTPYVIRVDFTSLTCPIQTPAEKYRMISIPAELDNINPTSIFVDNFGNYDKDSWRLIHDTGDNYLEYGVDNFGNFNHDMGAWLITRDDKSWDVGAGTSTTTADSFEITLHSGWNQIGHPFAFSVDWSSVEVMGNVEPPVIFTGSSNNASGYQYNQDQLIPWYGYYIKNLEDSDVIMKIPPKAVSSNAKALAKQDQLDPEEWQIQIIAKVNEFTDSDNTIGMRNEGSEFWDPHDLSEAPSFGDYISLSIPHDDWDIYPGQYTHDIRPVSAKGATWKIILKTNQIFKPIQLSFKDLSKIPQNFEVWLLDEIQGHIFNLREKNTIEMSITKADFEYKCQLIIGESEFLNTHEELQQKIPKEYALLPNFPNPFNGSTLINFNIPEASNVTIKIVNNLGKIVKILASHKHYSAGYHSITWDGLDHASQPVASGIYLCVFKTGGEMKIQKLLLVR